MRRSDFKIIREIADMAIKSTELSKGAFESTICATMSLYAYVHGIEYEDIIAGICALFLADLDEDEEVEDE